MDFVRIVFLILFLASNFVVKAQCDYDDVPACQDSAIGIPAYHWIQNLEEGSVVKTKIYLQNQTTYYFRSCIPKGTGPLWMVLITEQGQICLTNQLHEDELANQMSWFVKESAWYELGIQLEYGAGCCSIMIHRGK